MFSNNKEPKFTVEDGWLVIGHHIRMNGPAAHSLLIFLARHAEELGIVENSTGPICELRIKLS